MKLLGQIKPKRTPLQFLRRTKKTEGAGDRTQNISNLAKDAPYKNDSLQTRQPAVAVVTY
ncbi:hypothetical protein CK203_111590 [Vitis vinifera]|uniref:Uncharacterized protein n=1 Tax=Vitis vinifera TaxID=29760 RepID=A0A438FD33_VITVI|nr:hypothetical protein CK203_111590 [Vitis vinifera]